MRPSIRQLECLVAVADHGSFRKAAGALGISQPALSAQVQTAEALLALPVPGDVTTAAIAHEDFVVAAPRGAAILRGRVSEKDLANETVLLLEDGHCLRDQALAVCNRGGAVESVEVRATSLPT